MPSSELVHLVITILESVGHAELRARASKLHYILPENILVAALDIIDKRNVIKYTTPWGYRHYEVDGSIATYKVTLGMTISSVPFYCTCPAFTYAVLMGDLHIMCKHILAAWLAETRSLYVDRQVTQNDLEALFAHQHFNAQHQFRT